MFKLKEPFIPPRHPNWTGRAHRTSMDAFGQQWWVDDTTPRRRPGAVVLVLVALLLLLGVAI